MLAYGRTPRMRRSNIGGAMLGPHEARRGEERREGRRGHGQGGGAAPAHLLPEELVGDVAERGLDVDERPVLEVRMN